MTTISWNAKTDDGRKPSTDDNARGDKSDEVETLWDQAVKIAEHQWKDLKDIGALVGISDSQDPDSFKAKLQLQRIQLTQTIFSSDYYSVPVGGWDKQGRYRPNWYFEQGTNTHYQSSAYSVNRVSADDAKTHDENHVRRRHGHHHPPRKI